MLVTQINVIFVNHDDVSC